MPILLLHAARPAAALHVLFHLRAIRSRKAASSTNGSSLRNCSRSLTQPSPIASVISAGQPGLALRSQRAG